MNDLPVGTPFKLTGFPTLKFKPAGSREFIDYEGDRSIESLVEFIHSKAKNSLTQPTIKTPEPENPKASPETTHEASTEATPEVTPREDL